MADNVAITAGTGTTIGADEVADGTLGTVKVQYVKLMDGTLDGTTKAAVGANGLKVDGSGATQPVSGSLTTVSTVTNLSQLGGAAIAMGTGVRTAGTQRVTIATDDSVPVTGTFWQTTQPVSISGNQAVNVAQINGVTTTMGNGVSGTGVQRVTIASDSTGQVALAAGSAIVGKVGIDQTTPGTTNQVSAVQNGTWTVQPGNTANTTAWLTKTLPVSVSTQTALTTTATVSGSAGTYHGGTFINLNSVPSYIQVFDTTGAVTLGTTVPTFVQPIPANSTAANGAGFVEHIVGGITIANGIKVAATTTATGLTTSATALTGFITYR